METDAPESLAMPKTAPAAAWRRNLFGTPRPDELFAGIGDAMAGPGRLALRRIATKIGETRRPGMVSDIPAGATYLAQFVAHDLDLPDRDDGAGVLDLAALYGDGPAHDAFCYQVPAEPGRPRHLLRLGRVCPTTGAPAWGPLRDLPRVACPVTDARAVDSRSDVLVPNSLIDSNLLLGQVHTLFALLHNAAAGRLSASGRPDVAFALARRLTTAVYRDAVQADLLGTWLMPSFRQRYAEGSPTPLAPAGRNGTPREFWSGVGRIGHGLVREIYTLNATRDVVGLRNMVRHTSTGRPHEMPLTEDWLVDFSNFFAIGPSVPQRARAIGPHVSRPFATGLGAAADGSVDSLVLRDLIACTCGGVRSVRSLISQAKGAAPRIFEGCLAQDETQWTALVEGWLADTGLTDEAIGRLAGDPPLTLFLMLEADADTGGRTLGALGSIILGETIAAALPEVVEDADFAAAAAVVFEGPRPTDMAELIRFLQRHYRFGAMSHLHAPEDAPAARSGPSSPGGSTMFDFQSVPRQSISQIDVADHIEMGRVVAQWSVDPSSRPRTIGELRQQLEGIAIVPERIRSVEFVQGTLDHLVLRLPAREMIEESVERAADPLDDGRHPLPQFYADHFRPGFGPVMTPLDLLLARVGDCTISQCR